MTDRDITLSRRQLLGGTLTLGAASAASGAGTFAIFSDTETATGSITAGSLDLSIENTTGDVTNGDGLLSFLNATGVTPGASGSGSVTLKNVGSLDGYLTLRTVELTNAENGYSGGEPEDGNGEGELADLVSVEVSMSGPNGDRSLCGGGSLESFFVPDDTYDLSYPLAAGESATFTVSWALPNTVGNEIQGDSIGLELAFGLHQESTGKPLPTCTPVDIGDGEEDGEEEEEDDGGEPTVTTDADNVTVGIGDTATNSGSFDGFDDDPDVSASAGTVTVNDGTWSWSADDTDGLGSETVTITVTGTDGPTASATFSVTVELDELAACGISPDDLASETRSALVAAANAGKVSTVGSAGNNISVPAGGAVFLRTSVKNVNDGVSDGVLVVCGHEIEGGAISHNVKSDHLVLRDAAVGGNLNTGKSVSVVGSSSVGKNVNLNQGVLHLGAGASLVVDGQLGVDSLVLEPNATLEVGGNTTGGGGGVEIADSATVAVNGQNDNAGIETEDES